MKHLVWLMIRIRSRKSDRTLEQVILSSPLNGAQYDGESLPHYRWQWPTDTFLRRRLSEIAAKPTVH